MQFDPEAMSAGDRHRLLIGCIVPRPIAWVSTLSAAGVANLAPFSFFGGVSSDPPILCIAIGQRDDGKKDTWVNIEETGEFVVNVVSESLGARMVETSGDYPRGVSELSQAGLTPVPSTRVKPPGVAESPVRMECRLLRIIEVGNDPDALVLGQVVLFDVRDDVLVDGAVEASRLRALGRLGGAWYCRTGDRIELRRPRIERNP